MIRKAPPAAATAENRLLRIIICPTQSRRHKLTVAIHGWMHNSADQSNQILPGHLFEYLPRRKNLLRACYSTTDIGGVVDHQREVQAF